MRFPVLVSLALLLGGCADGGKEDSPQSEVKIAADHHLFGFRSLPGFGTFPVLDDVVFTDRGTLHLFTESNYTITRTAGTSSAERYALESDGDLSLYVSGSGREPSVVFRGAYSLAGGAAVSPDLFFTDRVSTPNSQSVGIYLATRVIPGQVELEGAWHVVSLHTIFDAALASPENVGRAVAGAVTVTAGAPGTLRTISGTGQQNAGQQATSVVTFSGSIQNLLVNDVGNGECTLILGYAATGQAADNRACFAAASGDLVLGLDTDQDDGEAGLVVMLKKFDVLATPADPARVPGRFLVGGHTLFINPSNPGSDAFVGVVTLSSQNGFRLDAAGNQGIDFAYTGTYALNPDGSLVVTITSPTTETWFAALDRDYQTLVLLDNIQELRSSNQPEINLGFGVRARD